MPTRFEILAEQIDNMRGIEIRKQRDSLCEVDEVPAFVTLEQRPELGGENLLAAKSDDIRLACEPWILDLERNGLGTVVGRGSRVAISTFTRIGWPAFSSSAFMVKVSRGPISPRS